MRKLLIAAAAYAVLPLFSAGTTESAHAQSLKVDSVADAIAGTPFERRQIKDRLKRTITYYISHPKAAAPILLMIQGSGCVPVMHIQANGTYSTLFDLLPFGQEGHFTVVAVEKPFSGVTSPENLGTAQSCGAQFNEDFTAESWLAALQAALQDARRSTSVDQRRTLLLGTSEGAVMAALLAAHDRRITDVIMLGGSGTTQLFDFIALAYRRCFDVSPCLADIDAQARAIAAHPSSSTLFAWGHPYKRWTSFFAVDPADELLHSRARVYLAFGTDDQEVPALSEEVAVAKLTAAGRDVTVRRVPNADHMLMQRGSRNFSDLDREFRLALQWFWAGHH